MACFMKSSIFLLLRTDNQTPALSSHHNFVFSLLHVLHFNLVFILPGGQQGGFINEIG